MNELKTILEEVTKELNQGKVPTEKKVYKFDIFKGRVDENGKIQRVVSLGQARLMESSDTYTVYIKSLLRDVFFLRSIKFKREEKEKMTILTREKAFSQNGKDHWNYVGSCESLTGENSTLLKMNWDFFGVGDVYMNLMPFGFSVIQNKV